MTDETGTRPMNVTIEDLSDDEVARLTPAQREVLSSGRGDLPVSHLSAAYNEPASAEFVDPRDPAGAAGDAEPTDTTERREDLPVETVVGTGAPAEVEYEGGNGDGTSPHVLDDADEDPDAHTGPMPTL